MAGVGWAFFLIITFIAPLFSPCCPWKVHVFKTMMKLARIYFLPRSLRFVEHVASRLHMLAGRVSTLVDMDEEETVIATEDNNVDVLVDADAVMSDDNLIEAMWEVLKHADIDPAKTITFVLRLLQHRSVAVIRERVFLPRMSFGAVWTTARAYAPAIRHILPSMLASIFIPNSLPTSIAETDLIQSPTHDANLIPDHGVVGGAASIPLSMLDVSVPQTLSTIFPDLHTLSNKAYAALMTIVAETLHHAGSSPDSTQLRWMTTASVLLLSDSPYTTSVEVQDTLITPMCQAVYGSYLAVRHPQPSLAFIFAERIIQRQFGGSVADELRRGIIPDLSALSEVSYGSLMSMTANAIQVASAVGGRNQEWKRTVAILLMSDSEYHLPSIVDNDTICILGGIVSQDSDSSAPKHETMAIFARRTMEHRLDCKLTIPYLTSIPDFNGPAQSSTRSDPLSNEAYDALMNMFKRSMDSCHRLSIRAEATQWMTEASILMVSKYQRTAVDQTPAIVDVQSMGSSRTQQVTRFPPFSLTDLPNAIVATMCNAVKCTMISNALPAATSEPKLAPSVALEFALCLLRCRYDISLQVNDITALPDLGNTNLPESVYELLCDIVSNVFVLSLKKPYRSQQTSFQTTQRESLNLTQGTYLLLPLLCCTRSWRKLGAFCCCVLDNLSTVLSMTMFSLAP